MHASAAHAAALGMLTAYRTKGLGHAAGLALAGLAAAAPSTIRAFNTTSLSGFRCTCLECIAVVCQNIVDVFPPLGERACARSAYCFSVSLAANTYCIIVLQCYDTVGLVMRPVKLSPK